MPILARVQPADINGAKNVFLSAIHFATSTNCSSLPFSMELKTSAQEQVEYMLVADEDTPLVIADDEVKSEVKMGLSKLFSLFRKILLDSLKAELYLSSEAEEDKVLQSLSDLEWMCDILPKMDSMRIFVISWLDISYIIRNTILDKKFDSIMWGVKLKVTEIAGKVLDAVSYGNVIVPATVRVQLLKIWLPYVRKMKPLLDTKGSEERGFIYKMDEKLCESIEGAITSLVLSLPSNDQTDILSEWMQNQQVKFPDLCEAFEVWCYRTKSAKRRLLLSFNSIDNATISL